MICTLTPPCSAITRTFSILFLFLASLALASEGVKGVEGGRSSPSSICTSAEARMTNKQAIIEHTPEFIIAATFSS
ncbi:hypothetical protein TrLO_g9851 [Triparma laevis f. longispina]|uniref:Secreted protein n=1 Tax=Triparma laevis f. longispina TaxID=1714387 RepID=A0A9W7FNK2_9STRA|nr:hypothetical protein TrLO_g9851 [Triparma laevis f. longispina]